MLYLGVANGRRVTDVILISFCALVATAFALVRTVTVTTSGVFRELWVRLVYICLSAFSCLFLIFAVGAGLTLKFRERKSGGSLALADFPSSAAIVCLLASIGLFFSTSSILILVVVYGLAKYNFFIVFTAGAMGVFTLLGAICSAALAHSAYRDEGEDVVEFENAPDKARHYWTAEDDAEITQESGLQY